MGKSHKKAKKTKIRKTTSSENQGFGHIDVTWSNLKTCIQTNCYPNRTKKQKNKNPKNDQLGKLGFRTHRFHMVKLEDLYSNKLLPKSHKKTKKQKSEKRPARKTRVSDTSISHGQT